MITYKRSGWIEALPHGVFAFVTDQANLPRWSPEVVKSEVMTGSKLEVGSKLRQTRRQGKRQVTSVVEVIAHEPPAVHAVRATIMGVEATFTFRFEPEGEGTRAQFEATIAGRGIGKLLERPLAGAMEKSDDQLLVRLKNAFPASNSM
ncbi:MAG: SRPBCC family protein [Chloroflexi bacterium]|nr:SRPBCC family protein [Chloroflexota bacterium]